MPGVPLSKFGLLKQLYESQWKGKLWDTDPKPAEDHGPKTPHFTVTLKCEGANLRLDDRRDDILGLMEFFGEGRNKKEAQNIAAANALQHFQDAGFYDPTDPEKYKKKDKGIVSASSLCTHSSHWQPSDGYNLLQTRSQKYRVKNARKDPFNPLVYFDIAVGDGRGKQSNVAVIPAEHASVGPLTHAVHAHEHTGVVC